MSKKAIKYILLVFTISILSACCGNSGSTGSPGGNVQSLPALAIAPLIIQTSAESGIINSNYLVINNAGDKAMESLSYTATDPIGGGNNVVINNTSCHNIAAHANCSLGFSVTPHAGSGSVRINIIAKNGTVLDSRVIGVQSASIDTRMTNVDGVYLFYQQLVENKMKYIVVTGMVGSSNVPAFNHAFLTDVAGNNLPDQTPLSANFGDGATPLVQGSSFSIKVPVPDTADEQNRLIKLKIQNIDANGTVKYSSLSASNYKITLGVKHSIVEILPAVINLTREHPEQTITLYNAGDVTAKLGDLNISDTVNIEISNKPAKSELEANATTTAVLKLKNPDAVPATGSVTLAYSGSGISSIKTHATVFVNGTSGGGDVPVSESGILAVLAPSNIFSATLKRSATNSLSLINTSRSEEYDFSFSLPDSFSLAETGSSSLACKIAGNMVTTHLAKGGSCNLQVIYTGSHPISLRETKIDLSYKYAESKPAGISIPVFYEVLETGAFLSLSPGYYNFGQILNDNSGYSIYNFVLTNNGDAAATNLDKSLTNTSADLFRFNDTTTCGTDLAANESCIIAVKFGPAPSTESGGVESAILHVKDTNTSLFSNLRGEVYANTGQNALIKFTLGTTSGFKGDGTVDNPYAVEEHTEATITYVMTNEGNGDANLFYIDSDDLHLPNGWAYKSGTCGTSQSITTTLKKDQTCTMTYVVNEPVGAYDFNSKYLTAHWNDGGHPGGTKTNASDNNLSVIVYQTPKIQITTTPSTIDPSPNSYLTGESFVMTARLIGGYQELPQTITLEPAPSASLITYVPDSGKCTIESNGSCVVNVNIGEEGIPDDYSLSITNGSSIPLDKNSLQLAIYANNVIIFTVKKVWRGNFAAQFSESTTEGAFRVADKLCSDYVVQEGRAHIPLRYQGKTFKALMYEHPTTVANKTYYREDGRTKIATATGGYLVESGSLVHSISDLEPSLSFPAWTGARPADLINKIDNCVSRDGGSEWWQYSTQSQVAGIGNAVRTNGLWWQPILMDDTRQCNGDAGFYCVSQ